MKKKLSMCEFIEEFRNSKYIEHFSINGLIKLYEYFDDLEEETGEEYNFNLDEIASDFREFRNIDEYINVYFQGKMPDFIYSQQEYLKEYPKKTKEDYEKYIKEKIEEYLNVNTILIKLGDDLNDGFIIKNYN